jgi:hypothetical protein
VALAWQNGYLQASPSITIPDNQNLITNNIILDKLVSNPCSVKGSSASCSVNDNMNIDNLRLLRTRTSSRVKKAPVTKRDFFYGRVTSRLISNTISSYDGPKYLNLKMTKGQLSHVQLGKFTSSSSIESSKNLSEVTLQIYHQNI